MEFQWDLINNPYFLPGIAHSENYLFRSPEYLLEGISFKNSTSIKQELNKFSASKPQKYSYYSIEQLPKYRNEIIKHRKYFIDLKSIN